MTDYQRMYQKIRKKLKKNQAGGKKQSKNRLDRFKLTMQLYYLSFSYFTLVLFKLLVI